MTNLLYCTDCKRVFRGSDRCVFCKSENFKPLKKDAPVNVIGTKIKGRIFKAKEDKVSIIVINEINEKIIKEYSIDKLQKIV